MAVTEDLKKTQVIEPCDISCAIQILKNGGVVAIPTETVYGLAANALDENVIEKIFAAKGRPSDNPLIVHISALEEIYDLIMYMPSVAQKLADAFWPGPLTMIFKKAEIVNYKVSAGLDTVAVRMPCHTIARKIIRGCKFPLAAPSANISGSPSPTKFQHVYEDLNGRIDAIVRGDDCSLGVESTVIDLCYKKPRLLRPGGITISQIEDVVGEIEVDAAVLNKINCSDKVSSPGMKYKHYSPRANVVMIIGDPCKYVEYVNEHAKGKVDVAALCFNDEVDMLNIMAIPYGQEYDYKNQAKNLFDCLRKFDEYSVKTVYAHCCLPDGLGLAVYNRLIRASGFQVIKL